ncbi:hypothetical protein [Clostridium sp.]
MWLLYIMFLISPKALEGLMFYMNKERLIRIIEDLKECSSDINESVFFTSLTYYLFSDV